MSVEPTAPTAADQTTSDPAPLVPTDTPVTAREIAEFLRHLTDSACRGATRPNGPRSSPQGRAVHPARRRPEHPDQPAGAGRHPMSTPTSTPSSSTPIIDNNALTASLRALKLSGMLQTLDARLAQARAGELGHLEFLQVLCQDEIARRETTVLARRIRRARFEEQATLEGFDFTATPKLPAAQIRDLAALRWLHAGESVILYGPVGVGKTHVAQALGHLAIRARRRGPVRQDQPRPGRPRRRPRRPHLGHAGSRELTRPAVLILDDFAMRELTAAQADDLYELISERAEPPSADPDLQPVTRSTGTRCSRTPSSPSPSSTG